MDANQHHQVVSERMDLESQAVGAIAMAGKPIATEAALIFFDLILALSPLVVEVIDLFGSTGAIGNDKPNIGPQRANFNLDQDSSSFVPAFGPVMKTIEESNRSFGAGIFTLGLFNPALGFVREDRV